jgi:phytoene/squalene synthetase
MNENRPEIQALAASITQAASKQTYYTIRYCVDRDLVNDAYLAYGYFRWVDDILDTEESTKSEKIEFIAHQKKLLDACYRGDFPQGVSREEHMLVDLVHRDKGHHPGLRSYLKNMMAILAFDANRRGELITQVELNLYSHGLATAVTDAMHYFIGHDDPPPAHESRYLAVNAAHITHMLRDTVDDAALGYFNIPRGYLSQHGISPHDVNHPAYKAWVHSRVQRARRDFKESRKSLAQINSLRCRLVGFAYTARFEWILRAIERDNYCLRSEYNERKGFLASIWMSWITLSEMFRSPWIKDKTHHPHAQTIPMKEL